jgi:hypothetical protein
LRPPSSEGSLVVHTPRFARPHTDPLLVSPWVARNQPVIACSMHPATAAKIHPKHGQVGVTAIGEHAVQRRTLLLQLALIGRRVRPVRGGWVSHHNALTSPPCRSPPSAGQAGCRRPRGEAVREVRPNDRSVPLPASAYQRDIAGMTRYCIQNPAQLAAIVAKVH